MSCKICEAAIKFGFSNDDELKRLQLCYACKFWWDRIEMVSNGDTFEGNRVARILNNHYIVYPDQPIGSGFLGFGGKEFVIRFRDGTEVTTHNLWHQGAIPERFRSYLPNNADFVDTRRTCKCRKKFFPMVPEQTRCTECVLSMGRQRW